MQDALFWYIFVMFLLISFICNLILRTLSCSYLCTDVTILPKTPTNALYVLITLLHRYTFQLSRSHPQGIMIHFVRRVNKIRVQMLISL